MYIQFNGHPWCRCYDESTAYLDARLKDRSLFPVRCAVSPKNASLAVADLRKIFPNADVQVIDDQCPAQLAEDLAQEERRLAEDPYYQIEDLHRRLVEAKGALLALIPAAAGRVPDNVMADARKIAGLPPLEEEPDLETLLVEALCHGGEEEICPYHRESPGWDECSEGREGRCKYSKEDTNDNS